MEITPENLESLYTEFSLAFQQGYSSTDPWAPLISTEVPSGTKSNTYGFVERLPKLREWVGPRIAHNLKSQAYSLANKKFELTVEVDRDEIEDDDASLAMYRQQIVPEFGRQVKKHPDQLITELMLANTALAYDGVALFSNAHIIGDGTYSNDFDLALTEDNFNTVWSAMVSYVGEDGEPLGVIPNLLFHAPQLRKQARTVLASDIVAKTILNVAGDQNVAAAGVSNATKGWAEPVMIEEWATKPNMWVLACTTKAIKPFVHQIRRQGNFVARDRPDDPKVFDLSKFTYGTDKRCAVGITLPWLVGRGKA
jgi:phage major head subunit gpT-like protein